MPDIQQEEIKFEKRKKQNTWNRPRAGSSTSEEVRSQRRASKFTQQIHKQQQLVGSVSITISIRSTNRNRIAYTFNVCPTFFDWPKKMTRTAAKAKMWHMSKYTHTRILPVGSSQHITLCVCVWERERACMLTLSKLAGCESVFVCYHTYSSTWLQLLSHMRRVFGWQHAMFLYVCRLLL